MINVYIDGIKLEVEAGTTILEAAHAAGIEIPTLCYLKDVNEIGACRMCVVEIKGARNLQAACVYPLDREGTEVFTNSPKVRAARKATLELILSNHERKCLTCVRNRNCELQELAEKLGVEDIPFEGENIHYDLDNLSHSLVRDNNKCILCRRCVSVCNNVQTVSVINAANRGFATRIGCAFDMTLDEVPCVYCGQCITAWPVGALKEKEEIDNVWEALADDSKYVVVQTAPAVRAGLGEEFGAPIGTAVTGKMVAALRRIGFNKVFDTDFAADLTIMEEGTELLERLKNGGTLPMITSCSPGWVKFCEHYYPEFIPNLSSCKSPHQMFGAVLKTYFAEKAGINPKDVYVVSVMPCSSKKYESKREEMNENGLRDIDSVITTRELAKMIKQANINFNALPDEQFDDPFGIGTGAGVIFGATGGVMEAAVRTVKEIVEGKEADKIDYDEIRGVEGIKTATVKVGDTDVKIAVAHGLGNARKLLDDIKAGKADYHFIEIMACPGGCVTGGGQPIVDSRTKMDIDVRAARAKAIYEEDKNLPIRKSHKNPAIVKIYEEFLGKPCGHKSHELLHTHYTKRDKF